MVVEAAQLATGEPEYARATGTRLRPSLRATATERWEQATPRARPMAAGDREGATRAATAATHESARKMPPPP